MRGAYEGGGVFTTAPGPVPATTRNHGAAHHADDDLARHWTRVRGDTLRGSSKGSLVLWRSSLGVVLDGSQTVRRLTNDGEWAARVQYRAMTRLLVADDHDVVRCGLRKIFEAQPTWEVVAEAADGEEAVRKALATVPDVAVIDYSMPKLNGAEVARRIRRRLPNTEVLVFTMYESEALIAKVLRAGARGYLLKSDASGHLIAAVEALAAHKPFFRCKGLRCARLLNHCGSAWKASARTFGSTLDVHLKRLGLNDLVADSVADEVRRGGDLQFAHDRSAMRLHRLEADVEDPRHLLVGVPLGNQLHDGALAAGDH